MKIVHVCTIDIGGAAVAAQRLHYGLLKAGIDSSMLILNLSNPQQYPHKYKFDDKIRYSISMRIKRKLGIPVTQKDRNRALLKGRKGQYEIFTFPSTDYQVENHPLLQEADVINLHWVSNFINFPTFFKKLKKPIVWTLHDMNILLGGFHYQGDLDRNGVVFGDLDKALQTEKLQELEKVDNLIFVTPSRWLGDRLLSNKVLNKKGYFHIPYGLDTTVFKQHQVAFARSVFNLPLDKKIILFVSDNIHNYRKGFDLLISAIKGMEFGESSIVVTIGNPGMHIDDNRHIISLGRITDDRLLSLLFAGSDVFVLPSREDNFPNVMLEAMACGTPVIAFSTGGMKEVIQNHLTGILVEEFTVEALRETLVNFISDKFAFDRDLIRKFAVENFDLPIQAQRYIHLYKKVGA